MFQCSQVFHANQQSVADIVINQGGTDAGKTVAIMQLLSLYAICSNPPKIDPIITIVSKSVPDSKKGAYRVAESFYSNNEVFKNAVKDWNKTDRVIYFKSGWVMEFLGATDEQTARQGRRQYLFCNEANGIEWNVFWQYAKRTRVRTFIDYNPSAPFWAHEKLIGTTKEGNDLHAVVQLLISDHRHNPFLSEADHAKTENIRDKDLWWVYARGKTGNLTGLIYTDWTMIPDKDFPWDAVSKFGGIDFGYTSDPTAAVRCSRIGNKIYIHELCYAPGINPTKLKQLYKEQGFKEGHMCYCDHDNDMILQLCTTSDKERSEKFNYKLTAMQARKTIEAGIMKVKEYEIYFTASSKNIEYERQKYMWFRDPDTGKPTNEPVDKDNHLMDAIRYAIFTHFYRG